MLTVIFRPLALMVFTLFMLCVPANLWLSLKSGNHFFHKRDYILTIRPIGDIIASSVMFSIWKHHKDKANILILALLVTIEDFIQSFAAGIHHLPMFGFNTLITKPFSHNILLISSTDKKLGLV